MVKDKVMPPTSTNNTDLATDYGQSCAIQIRIPTVISHRPPPTHNNSTVRSIPRSGASACQHKQFNAHGHGQITSALGVNKNNLVRIKCDHVHVQLAKKPLRVCCLNPRSIKNKALSLDDHIVAQDYDVALTETWLGTSVDKKCIGELASSGYTMKHVPRLAVVYRPPPSKYNGLTIPKFFDQWSTFLTGYATHDKEILIVGDLNFHVDVVSNRDAQRFMDTIKACGIQQHWTL